jgi:hypothetical protein
MAAAIKALNAKIRANPKLDYFCSTRMYTFLYRVAGREKMRGSNEKDETGYGRGEERQEVSGGERKEVERKRRC